MTAPHVGLNSSQLRRDWFVAAGGKYFSLSGPVAGKWPGALLRSRFGWLLLHAGLVLSVVFLPATLSTGQNAAAPPRTADAVAADAAVLTRTIDTYFERYWASQDVLPPPPADDAEFLRRAYLDLAGRIPAAGEAREFLAESASDKRDRLVERLLAQGAYARHFANTWTDVLLAGAQENQRVRALAPRLETWLRLRLAANLGFDQIAAQLLAAPAQPTTRLPQRGDALTDPGAFFAASDYKPELLAGSTSRVFLGLQVQCAQCHDHPHAHWTRQEFWSFASLFTAYAAEGSAGDAADDQPDNVEQPTDGRLKIPETETFVLPAFLDGSVPDRSQEATGRTALIEWLTGPQNPWFAAAIVNRVWQQLLGRGLIDPADDLEAAGPNDHAALLQLVAGQFRDHGYDLQFLLRAIAGTRIYRLTSLRDPAQPTLRHQFARMPLRKMTAVQLFDSLVQATGFREPAGRRGAFGDLDTQRAAFEQKFAEPGGARSDAETSIVQALALMNGKLVADATDVKSGETLTAVVAAPFLTPQAKVETLFLATLSRPPSADESRQFTEYVTRAGTDRPTDQRLADVLWALVNSAEFVLVH